MKARMANDCYRLRTLFAVALIAALVWTPATAQSPYSVLFVGNSHLFVNDVPARVRHRLEAVKGRTFVATFTKGGARLASFTRRDDIVAALASRSWDVVVLQEASATFLARHGTTRFRDAVAWFRRRLPSRTRIVLYQTWPWQDGSRYLARRGANSAAMWHTMRAAYADVAARGGVTVAPVGSCWMAAPERATFYSHDGNHAAPAGSRLAAAIISATILFGSLRGC